MIGFFKRFFVNDKKEKGGCFKCKHGEIGGFIVYKDGKRGLYYKCHKLNRKIFNIRTECKYYKSGENN